MRRPRLLLLSSVLGVAVLLVPAGCGVAADDTAATVNGTTISATLVNDLASSDPFMTAMTSQALKDQRVGVVDGDDARQVLAFLVQKEVLAQEVERWDAQVTSQDRSDAESRIAQQAPQLSGSERTLVADFLTDQRALSARLAELDPSDQADLHRLYDGLDAHWDRVCITAVAVPEASRRAAQRALDGGTSLADLEKRAKGAQLVAKKSCLAVNGLPSALRTQVRAASKGALVGPVTGVSASNSAVIWFRVESRSRESFDDARSELQALARSIVQQGISSWLTIKVNEQVTIDPRYGTEVLVDQSGLTVVAPAVPLGTGPEPGAAVEPGSTDSGSTGTGSTGSGSTGTGSPDSGSTGSGSTGTGSPDSGSTGSGSTGTAPGATGSGNAGPTGPATTVDPTATATP